MNNKLLLLLLSVLTLAGFASCSETGDEEDEYADWQNRNTTYFDNLYDQAVANQTDNLDTIRSYALTTGAKTAKDDYIVVKKIEEGTSTSGSPLFTDSVEIAYRGRLMPTSVHTDGYVFDQSFDGDFSWEVSHTAHMFISGTVTGFATALQKMKIGDRWLVYIPQKLGYGETKKSTIPAYSTLVFEISLHAFYRPDTDQLTTATTRTGTAQPTGVWIRK